MPSPPAEDSEPVPQPDANFADQMLQAVNAKRATTQICGSTEMPAVQALTWDHSLEAAAFAHSSDMPMETFCLIQAQMEALLATVSQRKVIHGRLGQKMLLLGNLE
ncbi:membrane protein [Vibrio sp. JCM 19236]|nr:membrane protein [Vibrio sp. JCM 19236]